MKDYIDLKAIAERLREIQERSGYVAKIFCEETGIPASSFSQIINGKSQINIDTLNKVIRRWSSLMSPTQFLFGECESAAGDSESTPSLLTNNTDDHWAEIIQTQAREIAALQAQLEAYKPKEIEYITVFYTDKSFATFTLKTDQ